MKTTIASDVRNDVTVSEMLCKLAEGCFNPLPVHFRISKQLRSQSSRSSLLLTCRKGYYGNDIGGTGHNLIPATRN